MAPWFDRLRQAMSLKTMCLQKTLLAEDGQAVAPGEEEACFSRRRRKHGTRRRIDWMNTTDSKKTTWQVHVRPINATHESWDVMKVEARSAIQAEAILRRRGFEMSIHTAMRVDDKPDPATLANLKPLLCASCEYPLAGLIIQEASVICPECSYPQPLIAWSSEQAGGMDKNHPVVGMFAVLGMFVVAIILFFILILVLSVWI